MEQTLKQDEEDAAAPEKESLLENKKTAILEAILFAYGAPIGVEKLANAIGTGEEETRNMLYRLKGFLESQNRGLRLLGVNDTWQLGTAPQAAPFIEKLVRAEFKEDLTPASLETLAIISYRGPISRSEIDYIRGVNSSFILRSLLIRGLISREPDPKRPQAWLYYPSFELLKLLGISSQKELPELDSFSRKLEGLSQPGTNLLQEPEKVPEIDSSSNEIS